MAPLVARPGDGQVRLLLGGRTQRGSILAAVIGLGMVMSLGAAALLLVAANSQNEEDGAFRRTACYLDAESGLMMGAAWLRAKGGAFITTDQGWNGKPDTLGILPSLENGSVVTVSIIDNIATKTVVSRAQNGAESMQYSWDIGTDEAGAATPKLKLTKWRSP